MDQFLTRAWTYLFETVPLLWYDKVACDKLGSFCFWYRCVCPPGLCAVLIQCFLLPKKCCPVVPSLWSFSQFLLVCFSHLANKHGLYSFPVLRTFGDIFRSWLMRPSQHSRGKSTICMAPILLQWNVCEAGYTAKARHSLFCVLPLKRPRWLGFTRLCCSVSLWDSQSTMCK